MNRKLLAVLAVLCSSCAHRIGDDGWPDEIWQGVNDRQIILYLGRDAAKRVTGHVDIHTMEGTMRGNVGDWIIRGVKGEFYPCKSDVFAATYDPVAGEAIASRHVRCACGGILHGDGNSHEPTCPAAVTSRPRE